jgi:hypothetical protein
MPTCRCCEPDGYGNIGWLPYLTISADPKVVYTAHDYTPFGYTHQEVGGGSYPGQYDVDGSRRSKRRRPKGGYSLTVASGTSIVTASSGRKIYHVGTPDGPQALAVTVAANATVTVDVFCGRR